MDLDFKETFFKNFFRYIAASLLMLPLSSVAAPKWKKVISNSTSGTNGGYMEFKQDTAWTVPAGVTKIFVTAIGGGGGGGIYSGGGGGSGGAGGLAGYYLGAGTPYGTAGALSTGSVASRGGGDYGNPILFTFEAGEPGRAITGTSYGSTGGGPGAVYIEW